MLTLNTSGALNYYLLGYILSVLTCTHNVDAYVKGNDTYQDSCVCEVTRVLNCMTLH